MCPNLSENVFSDFYTVFSGSQGTNTLKTTFEASKTMYLQNSIKYNICESTCIYIYNCKYIKTSSPSETHKKIRVLK